MTAFTELTSSQGDSPASRLVMLANEPERQMTATSGRKCAESLESLDPLGCLLKMLTDSSAWRSPVGTLSWKTKQQYARKRKWLSKQSGKTLKKSDIDPSQLLFQLAVSVPRTGDTESSFWATPNASDAVGTHGGGQSRSLRTDIAEVKAGLWPTPKASDQYHANLKDGHDIEKGYLRGMVHLWPTPHANCHTRGGQKGDGGPNIQTAVLWPTPTNSMATMADLEQARYAGNSSNRPSYKDAAAMWPTPAAQDSKNSTLPPSQIDRDTVPGAVMREGHTGQLNPEWVETLMGFPIGWTDGE